MAQSILMTMLTLSSVGINLVEGNMDTAEVPVEIQPFCQDLRPMPSVKLSNLVGLWHGVQLLDHYHGHHRTVISKSCPIIQIREIDDEFTTTELYAPMPEGAAPSDWLQRRRAPPRRLRLTWEETFHADVTFDVRYNVTRPGFWYSSGPHNGSTLPPKYDHFAGNIQVMDADGSRLLLTICTRLPEARLYSALLGRTPRALHAEDILATHALLSNRGLSVSSVEKVCGNGAAANAVVGLLTLAASLLFCVVAVA